MQDENVKFEQGDKVVVEGHFDIQTVSQVFPDRLRLINEDGDAHVFIRWYCKHISFMDYQLMRIADALESILSILPRS